jgi:Domain of unknown function (DUF1929)/Malectin domain/Bacterial Ig-like domain/Bacterial Ig domain
LTQVRIPGALRVALCVTLSLVAAGVAPSLARAAPAAPTGPTAIALASSVQLAWQPVAGAGSYTVYRGTSPTSVTTAVTPPGGVAATGFTDTGVANGTSYYYAVRAVVAGVESPNSLVVQATPVARSCSTGNPVVLENCYPGNTPWNARNVAAVSAGGIEGFATAQSINKGDSVDLKVNSNAGATFNVEIYRSGYYGGAGARLFSVIRGIPTTAQPACISDSSTGLVDCSNWSTSATITTTASWPSGIYLLRIVRSTGTDSQIILAVRDDARKADLLYGTAMSTFQAYNNYGGKSLYDFNSSGATTVAGTPRAVKVSFDRPYSQVLTGQRDWYTVDEFASVFWLERSGYDVSYASNTDLETNPSLPLNYHAYISAAHDEYWSSGMRTALQQARDSKINVFFTGANEIYWRIRFEASPNSGVANRVEVCYKVVQGGANDPSGIRTSTWRDPLGPNQPENALVGQMYIGDNDTVYFPFTVNATQGSDRIYRYTGLDAQAPGSSTTIGQSLVGWEWDARVANGVEPAGVKTLSGSAVNGELVQNSGASYLQNQSATVSVTKYTAPSGALVVSTGTIQWNRGLAYDTTGTVGEPDLRIQQTTTNILADMGAVPQTPAPNIALDSAQSTAPPPGGVVATAVGTDSIKITWNPVLGAVGYNVYRSLAPRDGGLPLGARANGSELTGTSYTDISLKSGTKYYYVVTADMSGSFTAPSAEASATTATSAVNPVRINAGGPALTAVSGATFSADGSFTGGQVNAITQTISGTNDPALYQDERWGQFTYSIAVPSGTYDVRFHFAELYYGTVVTGSCVGKRIFGMDILNTTASPDLANIDICAAVGPRAAYIRTVSGVSVTNGTLSIKSVYGSVDDPEITAIEVVPSGPTAPTVTANTPASGATGVATSVAPTATFSRAMDASTITTGTFTLSGPGGTVAAGVSYNSTTLTATLTPLAALAAGTTYTATLSTAVKSSDGIALASPYSWSFTTAAAADTTPPSAPTNLVATGSLGTASLTWTASTDNVGVTKYDVYRSQVQGFTPSASNRIAQPTGTSYTDTGLASGTYYYRVAAEDAAGNISQPSNEASATVTGDTTAPTVSITAPTGGSTVSGTVTVSASASDNVGVAGVQFKLDGVILGAEDTTSPYSVSWDTTASSNASHTLTAVARDAAGNATTSSAVTVTVNNTAPPPATYLFGDQAIESSVDFNNAGKAEAFQTTASSGGTATQITVYIDAASSATQIAAGLYANNGGHPGTLLAQGTLNSPKAGAWNNVPIASTSVTSGASYWIALLSPQGTGQLKFRDHSNGGGAAEDSSSNSLTTLPSSWTTGKTYNDGPASMYVAGTSSSGPPPSQVGQWSAPVPWPIVAVHMTLLPTGNVIAYDGFSAELNSERIWNPSTGTFTPVPYGQNIFCSGHVLLPDGRALIVGGHVSADVGTADTAVFNSSTNTWTREPDMSVTRWYPTATEMGNGKVFVFSGDNIVTGQTGVPPAFRDSSVNSLPEVYDPVSNTWTDLTSSKLTAPLYPQIFQLSDGRLIDVGPDTTTRTITPGTWQWQTIGTSPFDGMSAVMYLPDKIMKAGSWADPDFSGSLAYAAQGRTAVLDMTQASPAWQETSPMNFPRDYENLTLLPDGTVLASGGESASDGVDLTKAVLPGEIWDPNTQKWTTVASLTNGREYHSTALLLPDGRVLMAGGGQLPGSGATDQTNAEIYSPPYLFKGARPTITSTPGTIPYGTSFTVQTPDAASITKVALIRTPSVTHAFDQNQRYIPLSFTTGSGQLTVQAPSNANTAPPGYYMLFILNSSGVPSVASFVRLPAPWEDLQPPTAPAGLTATTGTGSIALSWTASTDNVGVVKYDIYRSTTSGFTPSSSNQIGSSATTTYTDTAVSSGTYYYLVKAEDAAGNLSAASNQASATITISDTTPPTVSVTAPANGATVSGTSVSVTANASDNIGVAGVQFKLDGSNLGSEDTTSPYGITWDTTAASNGTHTLTAVARDGAGNTTTSSAVTVTVSNATTKVLLGDQAIETKTDFNDAGVAEASQTTAIASGTLTKLSIFIDGANLSTQVLVGVYTDSSGHPGTLLSTGTLNGPIAGSWNTVNMTSASLSTGTTYWIALLSPNGAGQVKFRDRAGLSNGTKVEVSASNSLAALPATWASGPNYTDGPFSAYGSGT